MDQRHLQGLGKHYSMVNVVRNILHILDCMLVNNNNNNNNNKNDNSNLFINIFQANCYLQVKSRKKELLKPIIYYLYCAFSIKNNQKHIINIIPTNYK